MLAPVAALLLAQSPIVGTPAPLPIRLQVLRATSGTGAEQLLDGKASSGWRPTGDPRDEGILFRFEDPIRIDAVAVQGCNATGGALVVYVNGAEGPALGFGPEGQSAAVLGPAAARVKTVFLHLTWPRDSACLGEVKFLRSGKEIPVLPPRDVAGRITATSTLTPPAAYHPSYLLDGRFDFGWVEGAKGAGEGEVVTIELAQPVDLRAIEIWNGYQRSSVHYKANARVRSLEVIRDEAPPVPLAIRDSMGSQKLQIPQGPPVSRLRLRVVAAFPGAKYQDLVISELRLWDADGPLTIRTGDVAELESALRSSVAGTALEGLLDRALQFGCQELSTTRSLKLRRDHTFVAYEHDCSEGQDDGCSLVVLDGTWVPRPARGGWAELEIFARRHRADRSGGGPYELQAPRTVTSDEIAGGRLRIALAESLTPSALEAESRSTSGVGEPCSGMPKIGRVLVRGPALTSDFVVDGR